MSRTVKQIVYGAFYACVWAGLIYGFYAAFVRSAPTCTDNIKNAQETDVDCGGPSCISCEIKHLPPIQILPVKLLAGADSEHSVAVVELRNPNSTYGAAQYSYLLSIIGNGSSSPAYTEQVDLPMYPSEIKYRINAAIPVPYAPSLSAITTLNSVSVDWRAAADFPKPKLPTRNIVSVVTTNRVVVNGYVRNDNPYALRHINVNVLFAAPDGTLLSASRTVLNDMLASEERGFQVLVPLPSGYTTQTIPQPQVIIDGER